MPPKNQRGTTKKGTIWPLRPSSSGKGLGEGLREVPSSSQDKKFINKKKKALFVDFVAFLFFNEFGFIYQIK